jgi:hypothetical protein
MSISRLLSSATALVELSLTIDTIFDLSPTMSLVAYLQTMPSLRLLSLTLPRVNSGVRAPIESGKIVPLPRLTFFDFDGDQVFLDVLAAGLTAPSLQTLEINFSHDHTFPIHHFSRFITEIEARYYAFRVVYNSEGYFCVSLLSESEPIDGPNPHFKIYSKDIKISSALSTKFASVKELFLASRSDEAYPPILPREWRQFLELFPGVETLRLESGMISCIAGSLQCDHGELSQLLRSLVCIELRRDMWARKTTFASDEEQCAAETEAFLPLVVAGKQAGRTVNVYWRRVQYAAWKDCF